MPESQGKFVIDDLTRQCLRAPVSAVALHRIVAPVAAATASQIDIVVSFYPNTATSRVCVTFEIPGERRPPPCTPIGLEYLIPGEAVR